MMLFALLLTACGGSEPKPEEQIIGAWEYTDPDMGIAFTFDFQKDGKLVISAEGISFDLNYSREDADTIKLIASFDGESEENLADVQLEGDTLTLVVDGESQVLTRVK